MGQVADLLKRRRESATTQPSTEPMRVRDILASRRAAPAQPAPAPATPRLFEGSTPVFERANDAPVGRMSGPGIPSDEFNYQPNPPEITPDTAQAERVAGKVASLPLLQRLALADAQRRATTPEEIANLAGTGRPVPDENELALVEAMSPVYDVVAGLPARAVRAGVGAVTDPPEFLNAAAEGFGPGLEAIPPRTMSEANKRGVGTVAGTAASFVVPSGPLALAKKAGQAVAGVDKAGKAVGILRNAPAALRTPASLLAGVGGFTAPEAAVGIAEGSQTPAQAVAHTAQAGARLPLDVVQSAVGGAKALRDAKTPEETLQGYREIAPAAAVVLPGVLHRTMGRKPAQVPSPPQPAGVPRTPPPAPKSEPPAAPLVESAAKEMQRGRILEERNPQRPYPDRGDAEPGAGVGEQRRVTRSQTPSGTGAGEAVSRLVQGDGPPQPGSVQGGGNEGVQRLLRGRAEGVTASGTRLPLFMRAKENPNVVQSAVVSGATRNAVVDSGRTGDLYASDAARPMGDQPAAISATNPVSSRGAGGVESRVSQAPQVTPPPAQPIATEGGRRYAGGGAVTREPWEMTQAEYVASFKGKRVEKLLDMGGKLKRDPSLRKNHHDEIAIAQQLGKDIAPEILKDYPDLQVIAQRRATNADQIKTNAPTGAGAGEIPSVVRPVQDSIEPRKEAIPNEEKGQGQAEVLTSPPAPARVSGESGAPGAGTIPQAKEVPGVVQPIESKAAVVPNAEPVSGSPQRQGQGAVRRGRNAVPSASGRNNQRYTVRREGEVWSVFDPQGKHVASEANRVAMYEEAARLTREAKSGTEKGRGKTTRKPVVKEKAQVQPADKEVLGVGQVAGGQLAENKSVVLSPKMRELGRELSALEHEKRPDDMTEDSFYRNQTEVMYGAAKRILGIDTGHPHTDLKAVLSEMAKNGFPGESPIGDLIKTYESQLKGKGDSSVTLYSGFPVDAALKQARNVASGALRVYERINPVDIFARRPLKVLESLTKQSDKGARIADMLKRQSRIEAQLDGTMKVMTEDAMSGLSRKERENAILAMGGREKPLNEKVANAVRYLDEIEQYKVEGANSTGLMTAEGEPWKPLKDWMPQPLNKEARHDIARERGPMYDKAVQTVADTLQSKGLVVNRKTGETAKGKRTGVNDYTEDAKAWIRANRERMMDDTPGLDPLEKPPIAAPTDPSIQLHRLVQWPRDMLEKDLVEGYVRHGERFARKMSEALVFGPKTGKLRKLADRYLKDVETESRAIGRDISGTRKTAEKFLRTLVGRQLNTEILDPSTQGIPVSIRKAMRVARQTSSMLHLGAGSPFATFLNAGWGFMNTAWRFGVAKTIKHTSKNLGLYGKDVPLLGRVASRWGKANLRRATQSGALEHQGIQNEIGDAPLPHTIKNLVSGFVQGTEAANRTISVGVAMEYYNKAAKRLRRMGTADITETPEFRQLRDAGFSKSQIMEIAKEGRIPERMEDFAMQGGVEVSQYLARPMDLPLSWSSPVGRMATQFWSMAYQQTIHGVGFVLREAGHGNLMPLVRFLILAPAMGLTSGQVRQILSGRDPDDDTQSKFMKFARWMGDSMGVIEKFGAFAEPNIRDALRRQITPVTVSDAIEFFGSVRDSIKSVSEGETATEKLKGPRRLFRMWSVGKAVDSAFISAEKLPPMNWQHTAPYTRDTAEFYRLKKRLESQYDRAKADIEKTGKVAPENKFSKEEYEWLKWSRSSTRQVNEAMDKSKKMDESKQDRVQGNIKGFFRKARPKVDELRKKTG